MPGQSTNTSSATQSACYHVMRCSENIAFSSLSISSYHELDPNSNTATSLPTEWSMTSCLAQPRQNTKIHGLVAVFRVSFTNALTILWFNLSSISPANSILLDFICSCVPLLAGSSLVLLFALQDSLSPLFWLVVCLPLPSFICTACQIRLALCSSLTVTPFLVSSRTCSCVLLSVCCLPLSHFLLHCGQLSLKIFL